jgi:hypothetical protein
MTAEMLDLAAPRLQHLGAGCVGYWVVEQHSWQRRGFVSCTECGALRAADGALVAEAAAENRAEMQRLFTAGAWSTLPRDFEQRPRRAPRAG